jgi:hypothetical protein
MNQYPHVFFTSPEEWDPTVLDFSYTAREEWTHLGHPEGDDYIDIHFDDHGQSTHRVIATLNSLLDLPPPSTEVSLGLDPG